MIKLMDILFIFGKKEEIIKEIGIMVKFKEKVFLLI